MGFTKGQPIHRKPGRLAQGCSRLERQLLTSVTPPAHGIYVEADQVGRGTQTAKPIDHTLKTDLMRLFVEVLRAGGALNGGRFPLRFGREWGLFLDLAHVILPKTNPAEAMRLVRIPPCAYSALCVFRLRPLFVVRADIAVGGTRTGFRPPSRYKPFVELDSLFHGRI
jgi:hypothetical protein